MKQETIPHWKLERYLLGELPPAELANITAQSQVDYNNRLSVRTVY